MKLICVVKFDDNDESTNTANKDDLKIIEPNRSELVRNENVESLVFYISKSLLDLSMISLVQTCAFCI